MKTTLKLFGIIVLAAVVPAFSFAQQNASAPQKFALVIGNGAYTGMSRLANPVNDANDITAALQGLGFTVDKVLDGNLAQMESAIMRLKNRLSVSKNSYGFFFYAGHGVQSGGANYLIPVGASIPSENFLRDRAVSVQAMLGELNDAGNELNVVVLDACRDNPFSWARSGNRGLSVVGNQPADSIIVYATSAGSTAADGTGRNGLFTSQLLKNIKTPGLEVSEIFRLTGADVAQVSERKQIPAVYNQFFGRAYLGAQPAPVQPTPAVAAQPAPAPAPPATKPAPVQPTPAPAPAATTIHSTSTILVNGSVDLGKLPMIRNTAPFKKEWDDLLIPFDPPLDVTSYSRVTINAKYYNASGMEIKQGDGRAMVSLIYDIKGDIRGPINGPGNNTPLKQFDVGGRSGVVSTVKGVKIRLGKPLGGILFQNADLNVKFIEVTEIRFHD